MGPLATALGKVALAALIMIGGYYGLAAASDKWHNYRKGVKSEENAPKVIESVDRPRMHEGVWMIFVGSRPEYRVQFFYQENAALRAKVMIEASGVWLEESVATQNGRQIGFAVATPAGDIIFDGIVSPEGNAMTGTFGPAGARNRQPFSARR